jgi:hypothetical protein
LAATANLRDEARYRQANSLGPVANIVYFFRYPTDEGLGVALSSVLVADDLGGPPGASWEHNRAAHNHEYAASSASVDDAQILGKALDVIDEIELSLGKKCRRLARRRPLQRQLLCRLFGERARYTRHEVFRV